VNTRFEKKEEEAPENYLIKKRKVALDVFNDKTITLSSEEKEIFHVPAGQRITYIKNNLVNNHPLSKIMSLRNIYLQKMPRELKKMIIVKRI